MRCLSRPSLPCNSTRLSLLRGIWELNPAAVRYVTVMDTKQLHIELQFRTSRSSGAGGQHVNKVATQVELLFDVDGSIFLSDTLKARIKRNLKNRINKEGVLQLRCSSSRSQHRNKQLVIQQFDEVLTEAMKAPPRRKKVKTAQAHPATRLRKKKLHSEKKAMRKKIIL